METYIALLQNYQSRDKILRTIGYASAFASGGFKGKMAQDLGVVAKSISSVRLINRMLDDIPMWTVTRTWGAGDKDSVSRMLSSLANLSIQLFFPMEKVAWLADNQIISLNSAPWQMGGIACWALFLVFNIFRSLRQLGIARHQLHRIIKQRKLESPEQQEERAADFRKKIYELKTLRKKEFLSLVKNMADLVMCINWLPLGGLLWSGKLSPARTAFFGTISSLIGLLSNIEQYHANKKTAKKE